MGATWNETPSANRLHIGVFGKTNSGKSSFINAFTGQEVSIVADVAGTTTDPVYKAMEIYPMGPCTIMDWKEASRFGLMVADENDRITEFQEKPPVPKSNLASMGIYIFNWDVLKKYLEEDEADPNSKNDFGMNIIPALLRDGRKMYAYRFAGYWRDVGTIDSLWEANMEVLDPENSGIDIFDEKWKIYSRNPVLPPQKIGPRAVVQDSLVTEGCKIYGNVHHSVLSAGVVVEEGATVEDAVLMDGVVVKAGAVVKRCILAEDVVVGAGARVGGDGPIAHVGTGLTVGAGATVKEGAKVFESVKEGMEVC